MLSRLVPFLPFFEVIPEIFSIFATLKIMKATQADIAIIGAGNVATHLIYALQAAGYTVKAIMRHRKIALSLHKEEALSRDRHRPVVVTEASELPEAGIYIYSVSDGILPKLAEQISHEHPDSLHIHTSGSTGLDVFAPVCKHCGVLYPLQTFTASRELDFSQIPCFVEGNTADSLAAISALAHRLTRTVAELDSRRRRELHLAAVFACNFVNHCYAIATERLIQKAGVSPEVLVPLIGETAAKACQLGAMAAQTGPAVRADERILACHQTMLIDDPLRQQVYETLSHSIHDYATRNHVNNNQNHPHDKL